MRRTILRRLRKIESLTFVRWCALAGLSFTVNVGLAVGLHMYAGLSEEVSFFLALATVFTLNFLVMRHYVYRARHGHGGRQLTMFLISSLIFRGSEYLTFLLFHTYLGTPYVPTLVTILLGSFIVKYFVYGMIVFRTRLRAGERAGLTPPLQAGPHL